MEGDGRRTVQQGEGRGDEGVVDANLAADRHRDTRGGCDLRHKTPPFVRGVCETGGSRGHHVMAKTGLRRSPVKVVSPAERGRSPAKNPAENLRASHIPPTTLST